MKWRSVAFFLGLAFIIQSGDCRRRRMKRRIDEFGQMVAAKTDRSPFDFNGYGNWCGLGGSGETVDEIDRCCMVHDKCYAHVNRDECKTWLKYRVYTTKYTWKLQNGEIVCKDDDHCKKTLCECDKAAAECFGKNNPLYNTKNKHAAVTKGISNTISKLLG